MGLVEYIQKLHELNAAIEDFIDTIADIGSEFLDDGDYVSVVNWLRRMSSSIHLSVWLMSFEYHCATDHLDNPDKAQECLDRLNAVYKQGDLYMKYIDFEADWNRRFTGWSWPWRWGAWAKFNAEHRKIQELVIGLAGRFMIDVKIEDLNDEDDSIIHNVYLKTNSVTSPKGYDATHKRVMESLQESLNKRR